MKTVLQINGHAPAVADFYELLHFQKSIANETTYFNDQGLCIELHPKPQSRTAIKLYKDSWQEESQLLKDLISIKPITHGCLACDCNGIWIYLLESKLAPAVATLKSSPSLLGTFAGLSVETIDSAMSKKIWSILGFHRTMGAENNAWFSMANAAQFNISFMINGSCPHLFFNPSLTYFNGKTNLAIIEKIKSLQIPISEEITAFNKEGIADNIIIRDPSGLGMFIFSD